MRLLHTSDWHLGQTLHQFDRTYEHAYFLNWLVETLTIEQPDALLIAGDIFDNANPSATAQRQLYQFLQTAKSRVPHLNIVLTAGNHDSPNRLEAPTPLLEGLGITIVGQVRRASDGSIDLDPLVVPLTDGHGHIKAWCLAIPFLRPGDVPRVESDGDPYAEGVAALYRQALALALAKREPGQAIIALGHCHMSGGESSADSERRIVIGGTDALPAGMFTSHIAYAGLGHLHKAQRVARQDHVRYCGSPLPMSFAEVDYPHQILRIDLNGETVRSITEIHVPRSVELLRIPKKPAPLPEVLRELAALELPEIPDHRARPYLEVRIRFEAPEPGLRSRIEAALENKPVRLAKIESSFVRNASESAALTSLDDLGQLQPADIFKKLYQSKLGNEAPAEQLAAFAELLAAHSSDAA